MLISFCSSTSKTAGNDNHRLTQWFCNGKTAVYFVKFVTFDTCMFYTETVEAFNEVNCFFLNKEKRKLRLGGL